MARSNRPRRGGRPKGEPDRPHRDDEGGGLAHLLDATRRTEVRRGAAWTVQPISAERAVKTYSCPGCGRAIDPHVAHVAVWRAEFVLGDDHALDGRRHWHSHCWRIA